METRYNSRPFDHWVIDGLFSPSTAAELYAAVPPAAWPGWEARYENDCERHKRTCRDPGALPDGIFGAIGALNSRFHVTWLRVLTGIADLDADPTLHGGGLHVTEAGGWLSPHLDYARHPVIGNSERRVNVVAFLNPTWEKSWGGAFELWDADAREVVKRVYPAPGRAVVWLPTDTAFHGTQRLGPDAPDRATIAVYYLAPLRPGVTRSRALFVPNRGK